MLLRRGRAALLLMLAAFLAPAVAACTSAQAGSAEPAASVSVVASIATSAVSTTTRASPAPTPTPTPAPTPTSATGSASGGGWTSALIEIGSPGIPSPTGDLTAVPTRGRICFESTATGPAPCGDLAAGDEPVFAVYSPDGDRLLVVAGPDDQARAVYVLDTADGGVRVVGPAGITADATSPSRWNLSSVAWATDGSAVVLVPHTDGDTGPMLSADLGSGAVTEMLRIPADLANGRPSIWPTRHGTAVVGTVGADLQTVWWAEPGAAELRAIGRFDQPGGSVVLAAADPLGRSVLVCPRNSDGRLGATIGIAVQTGESGRILSDSVSCAGAVFSPDGQYAAMTARLDSGYVLIVVDLAAGRRVLTVPMPVTEPSAPPYLTWLGETVVISDVSGEWANRSLVVRLR